MNKKALTAILSIMMTGIFILSGCSFGPFGSDDSSSDGVGWGSDRKESTTAADDFDNPEFANEQDGANPIPVEHKDKDFVGTWATASDYAEYLRGNVKLVINSNHTWNGIITDESFSGKWSPSKNGICIKDSENIVNWELFYTQDDILMFRDNDHPDIKLVLKKVQ